MARKKLLTEGEIRQFMKLANLRPLGKERLSEMGMGMPGARDDEMGDEMGMEMDAEMGDEDAEMEMDMDMDAGAGGGDMVSMDDFMSALERAIEEVTGEEADVSEEPGDEEMEMADDDMEMDMDMGPEEEEPMMEEDRKGHGGGARSDDPEKNKRGKFGKPDEEEPDKYASGEGAGKGEKAARRSGAPKSAGRAYRGMDESEELSERKPHMGARSKDPEAYKKGKFGEPDEEKEDSMAHGAGAGKGEKPQRYKGSKGRRPSGGVGIAGITSEEIVNEVAQRVAARLQAENSREQMVDQLAERIMKRLTNK